MYILAQKEERIMMSFYKVFMLPKQGSVPLRPQRGGSYVLYISGVASNCKPCTSSSNSREPRIYKGTLSNRNCSPSIRTFRSCV